MQGWSQSRLDNSKPDRHYDDLEKISEGAVSNSVLVTTTFKENQRETLTSIRAIVLLAHETSSAANMRPLVEEPVELMDWNSEMQVLFMKVEQT